MSKPNYSNLISTYDTFASWLTKTNELINDMRTSVVTTNATSTPDVTTGNGYVNGFFGSNTMYVVTGLHGGIPTALANLNISSNLVITSNTFISANLLVTGTANVTVNLNSVGIVSNNITVNNTITVTNTATLNTATAVTANITTANVVTLGVTGIATTANLNVTNNANLVSANITTANVTTLGVTGLATFVNATVGSGTSNVQANTTQITISNPSATATVNATTFSGTAANATLLNNQNGAFYTNATNITTGNLPWAQAPVNTVNTTGAFTFTGIHTYNVNAVVNTATLTVGNASVNVVSNTTTLAVSNSTSSITVNSGIIFVGNASANVTVNSSVFSGTANNSLALGGYIANTTSPSDGFVLAFNQSENRIKWTNPSGISTALNSNSVVANASLQAGSNGSTYVLTAEGNTVSTNLVMRANNIALTVDSGNIRLNSNTLIADRLLAGNTDANVTIVTSTITIQNSSSVATLTPNSFSRQANGATHLGPEGSGVNLSTLQGQITGNASTAYTNATNFASNATNITSGTLSGSVLPASVVNTSGSFVFTGLQTYNANLFINTANQLLIGNGSVNAVANQTTLAVFNSSSNLVVNASAINIGSGAAIVNSTFFSRQANGASFLGPEGSGVNLSTLQGQFTSNDATTYSNATTFASNASNITTGTLGAGRLPASVVNTSASFTLAGAMVYDGTARFNANVGFNIAPGSNSSRFNVLFPTTTHSTDVLLFQKTRDSANAARYGFTDVGGLTTDTSGAFWRGFHFAAPSITDGAAVQQFPRLAIAAETETLTNPSSRRWLLEAGNDSATSRYSIVFRTANADRLVVDGGGNVAIGWTTTTAGTLSVNGPETGTVAGNIGLIERLRAGTGNAQGIDFLNIRNSAGSDWTTAGTRIQSFVDVTFMSYMQFNGNNNNNGISWGTGSNTTDRNTIAERMRIVANGHVGINTTSPFSTLHATKIAGTGAAVAATGSTDGTSITRFGAGIVGMDFGIVDSGPAYIQVRNVSDFSTKYNLFLNPTGGNVGVGLSDPDENLTVQNNIRARGTTNGFAFIARAAGTVGWNAIQTSASTASGYFATYNSTGTRIGFNGWWDLAAYYGAWTDGTTPIIFGTNNATRYTIQSDGVNYFTTTVNMPSGMFVRRQGSSEGGEIILEVPSAGFTSLSGTGVIIDINGNDLRIFDNLGTTRGASLNIAACSAGAASPIIVGDVAQTLSSKRINPRVSSAADGNISPDIATADVYIRTALAGACTINTPTGTPLNGNRLIIRLRDNGTARALTWTGYRAVGVTLPTTTTASKTTYVGVIYNSDESTWDAIAVSTQA
jgi:hypothetical protein